MAKPCKYYLNLTIISENDFDKWQLRDWLIYPNPRFWNIAELSNTRVRSLIGLLTSFPHLKQIVPGLGFKPLTSRVTGTIQGFKWCVRIFSPNPRLVMNVCPNYYAKFRVPLIDPTPVAREDSRPVDRAHHRFDGHNRCCTNRFWCIRDVCGMVCAFFTW